MIQEVKKIVKKTLVKKVVGASGGKKSISSEMIAQKAYELYEKRGGQNGSAEQDWLEAKKLLEAGE